MAGSLTAAFALLLLAAFVGFPPEGTRSSTSNHGCAVQCSRLDCNRRGPTCLKPTATPEKLMEDRWMSVDKIAAHLGVKRETICKWIPRQSLPARKVGRLRKMKRSDVDRWVETRDVPPSPTGGGVQQAGGHGSDEE